ncbi:MULTISPECIES: DUF1697 domain-containing protein [Clostridium]|jgi:uncharacterized protein (DUF1697 family)|uniref:DUF1697 domain-containing protein n=2 Tax=root TaxID=1 RepID=R9C6U6_9CLOT|nr:MULTISPECIES: DUF1697 domain-containing protein [Clostridium]EOR25042.1 hypothetical protein A500_11114 [Clostridium sartagoforme AAU1]KLE15309.1 hypothetical protein AAT22_12400 [Clostridium sp. C8]
MIYVALLRGINVGGKNKIDMKLLKETFILAGMESVITYINSGNVIFTDMKHTKSEIAEFLEEAIFRDFQLNIKVLIRSQNDFEHMMKILPESWKNDKTMRSDVLFLWEEFDRETVINEFKINKEVDTVIYVAGAILWTLDKANITKSGLNKLVGTDLYKKMTVRNVNTTRKIYEIMKGIE